MFSLKHIGVYFLLLVYSVSFGHQIIPHHHHGESEVHNHHIAGTHDHCVNEEETHNHVAHNDHFDEGIIDFLGCILGNHEHNSSTECEFIELKRNPKNKVKSVNFLQVLTPSVKATNADLALVKPWVNYHYSSWFNNELLARNRTTRGPPQA